MLDFHFQFAIVFIFAFVWRFLYTVVSLFKNHLPHHCVRWTLICCRAVSTWNRCFPYHHHNLNNNFVERADSPLTARYRSSNFATAASSRQWHVFGSGMAAGGRVLGTCDCTSQFSPLLPLEIHSCIFHIPSLLLHSPLCAHSRLTSRYFLSSCYVATASCHLLLISETNVVCMF